MFMVISIARVRRRLILPPTPVVHEYLYSEVEVRFGSHLGETVFQIRKKQPRPDIGRVRRDAFWVGAMIDKFVELTNEARPATDPVMARFLQEGGAFGKPDDQLIIPKSSLLVLGKAISAARLGGPMKGLFFDYRSASADQVRARGVQLSLDASGHDSIHMTCQTRTLLDAMAAQLTFDRIAGRLKRECAWKDCTKKFMPKRQDRRFCGSTCARKAREAEPA